MSVLRLAIGRKEFLAALLVLLVAGVWLGWRMLAPRAQAQQALLSDVAGQLRDLLEAGRCQDVVTQADALLGRTSAGATVLRYKAVAQHLLNDSAAEATADATLAAAPTGPDAGVALAVKALEALRYERLQVAAAKQAATAAMQQAGDDPMGVFLARVAYAAAVRHEADPAKGVALRAADPASLHQQAAQIRQTLEPLYTQSPTEPTAVWQKNLWRWGLALLADGGILASEAGEATGEAAALAVLRQSCPEDAWACYFGIPEAAVTAARYTPASTSIDDHARVAMLTACGFLYTQAGDRIHCDPLLRKAIRAYGRLLENKEAWSGEQTHTVTPQGSFKKVGQEYYTYRNRMENLAKYSADWWGIRVVRGEVDLATALTACDQKLFRAIVRVRADRDTNPVRILHDERLPPPYYETVADWFGKRLYDPQADWERARANLLQVIGREEVAADQAVRQSSELQKEQRWAEAMAPLLDRLATEPTLAETGVSLRFMLNNLLIFQQRHQEVQQVCEAALRVIERGDPYLGHDVLSRKGYILQQLVMATWSGVSFADGKELAETMAADLSLPPMHRMWALSRIARFHALYNQRAEALDAYGRLKAFALVDPADGPRKDEMLAYAQGWLQAYKILSQADEPLPESNPSSSSECCSQ